MATTRKKPVKWLIAQQTVTVDADGRRWPLLAGVTRVTSDHPAAKARPDAFRDDVEAE